MKTSIKKLILTCLAIFTIFICFPALAQTNNPSATATPIIQGIVVNNAAEALGAFIHFCFPSIGIGESMFAGAKLLAILVMLARIIRKVVPDNLQVNKIGLALANIACEVNPTIEKLAQAAQETKKPTT